VQTPGESPGFVLCGIPCSSLSFLPKRRYSLRPTGEASNIGDLTALNTHRVPFRQIDKGFRLLETEPEDVVKILVTYDE
jgi:hypothetical protein